MSKTYDIETIVTAEIDELQPNVEIGERFDFETYKAIVAQDLAQSILLRFPDEFRLKTGIKVQVFLHEKDENAPKGE